MQVRELSIFLSQKLVWEVDYNPRAAGINVTGSLDGDATIVLTIAQKTDVLYGQFQAVY